MPSCLFIVRITIHLISNDKKNFRYFKGSLRLEHKIQVLSRFLCVYVCEVYMYVCLCLCMCVCVCVVTGICVCWYVACVPIQMETRVLVSPPYRLFSEIRTLTVAH